MTVEINPPNAGENASLPCDSTLQSCPHVEEEPRITIRVSLFFDGTLNNRSNTDVRRRGGRVRGDSYENDYSNIAKLQRYYHSSLGADIFFSLYIEGIGTTDGRSDSDLDTATGTGNTGIHAKVERGLRQLIGEVQARTNVRRQIDCIYLDTFGFSRGAAAARHCIYAALSTHSVHYRLYSRSVENLKNRLISVGYSVNHVEVKFVGLFDTVSSYGYRHRDFSHNVIELKLDSIRHAQRVVQLAAAEEHRKNFSLTNINSARNGTQLFLPGVHSDIGGGYVKEMQENNLVIYQDTTRFEEDSLSDEDRRRLLDAGWFTDSEVETSHITLIPDERYEHRTIINRRVIKNHYSRIPLHLMIQFAEAEGIVFTNRYTIIDSIPRELDEVKRAIDRYRASHPGARTSVSRHWYNDNSPLIRELRHRYLHFSAHYTLSLMGAAVGSPYPHEPRFTDEDSIPSKRKRNEYDG